MTTDRATPDLASAGRARFYASEALSPRQRLTPEGFLICEAVPIARTGTMIYGPGETPIAVGQDGITRIERTADEVFAAATLASFEGKPVTLDHPSEFVGPGNWAALAKGVVQNVRRGAGLEDDLLLADLLITDQTAIDQVRAGLREVSCGYDADYQETEPGRGVQRQIIGNHVALVERGRCGPRCAIGDKEPAMAKRSVWDRIRKAFKAKDEAEMEAALEEAEKAEDSEGEEEEEGKERDKGQDKALDAIMRRLDSLEARLSAKDAEGEKEDETKDGEGEEEEKKDDGKTGDRAPTIDRDRWQGVIARAEILAPGLQMPTFDAKGADALCACQRAALQKARDAEATRELLAPLLAGRDVSALTSDALDALFTAAAEMVKRQNNGGNRRAASVNDFGRATSAADINRRNAEFWAKRNAG